MPAFAPPTPPTLHPRARAASFATRVASPHVCTLPGAAALATTRSTTRSTTTATGSTSSTTRAAAFLPAAKINLRLPGASTALLPADIYVRATAGAPLASLFAAALHRHPEYVGRYILLTHKQVIQEVPCQFHSLHTPLAALLGANGTAAVPRLIFCVRPNEAVVRALAERREYTLHVTGRCGRSVVLGAAVAVRAGGGDSLGVVWEQVCRVQTYLRRASAVAAQVCTGGVPLRFGMDDVVADVVQAGGCRVCFLVARPRADETAAEAVSDGARRRGSSGVGERLKRLLRLRTKVWRHGARKVLHKP